MRPPAALLWLLGACTMCLAFPDEEQLSTFLADPQTGFQQWMQQYGRSYSEEEQARRFPAWEATLQYVRQHRTANELHSWSAGLTEWADWTDDEFRAALLGQRDILEAHEDDDEIAGDEHGHEHQKKHHDAGHEEDDDDEAEGLGRRLQHDKHHKEHKDHKGHHKEHKHHQHDKKHYRYENSSIPDSVNWPEQGIVSPIKNQHVNGSKCGCCWSFASVAVAECLNNMANKNITSLSEQQLIDCDHKPPYVDGGCKGGDFIGGLWYIINNGGIDNDTDYPYEAKDDKCQKEKEEHVSGTLDGVEKVPKHNETALAQAVTHHPVGVGICVGPNIIQWRAYTGGIFDIDGCHKPIDHGMVVVGYGSENSTDYWLLKNSWGETSGEKGYMKVPKGLGGKGWGALAGAPAYPLKKGVQLELDSPVEVLVGPGQHPAVQQA